MRFLLRRFLILLVAFHALTAFAQQYRVDTLIRAPRIQLPSAIAFVPGARGAFFLAERSTGEIRFFDGRLQAAPFVTIAVEDENEQGLLGLAVHPDYPDSPYVYVYYVRALDRAGILERYRDQDGIGVSPQLLLFIARRDEATNGNGGVLRFGPDGKLYVAVGDHGFRSSNAQDTLGGRNLRGKILRLNPDGTVPSDNPFPRRYFWSLGHRDPRGLGFDPVTGALYATESGLMSTNQIVKVSRGANLGWPGRRPSGPDPAHLPRVVYSTGRGEQPVLTGVAVYRGRAFPRMEGKILFAGNANPTLWAGTLDADGDSVISVEPLFHSNTGFADVQVGPDGCIYIVNGPYLASRILRLSPVLPQFAESPPVNGKQGEEYRYIPAFRGTPPQVSIVAGPEGMTLDSVSWGVRWIPTNAQALEGTHQVILRARNGAGFTDQRFTVTVENVNDPPSSFALTSPPDGSERRFLGEDPSVVFTWIPARDPDLDTVRYTVQIDTVATFDTPFCLSFSANIDDSLRVNLPPASHTYYWRVAATDGKLTTLSLPRAARLDVIVSKLLVRERAKHVESVPEQSFPIPFKPGTTIRYKLPRGGYVRLTVYNLLGQEVARLVEGIQQEGAYEVNFADTNIPNGIYFYRLIAPGFAETKKMIVAK